MLEVAAYVYCAGFLISLVVRIVDELVGAAERGASPVGSIAMSLLRSPSLLVLWPFYLGVMIVGWSIIAWDNFRVSVR
jgi:hypothetical protein